MVRIVQSYGHNDVACPQVKGARKALLQPELLQFYLASLFGFNFPFASFLIFALIGRAASSMLKLNLCAHAPSLSEVVS